MTSVKLMAICVLFLASWNTLPAWGEGSQFNFSTSGSNSAGGTYTVMCVVTAESPPSAIEWMDPQGGTIVSGGDFTLCNVTMEENTTSSRSLQFSPLRTSHGGEYTCQATVEFETMSRSVDVNVKVSISSVMVAQSPDRTLYTEDDLTLTCTIELNEAVDTGVVVTVVWIGQGNTRLSTGGRITVSDVTGSRPTYQSIVVITSLEMSDSGAYTCTVTASGNGPTFITESQPAGSATTTVQSVEPFDVTITDTGMSTAGQMYTLTCSVEVPGTPSIQWQYSNGSVVTNGGDITVGILETSGTTTTLTLTFNPLLTSHGGQYACQATAETTGVNRTAMWKFVTVQISAPSVMVAQSPDRTLYTKDDLTLTCTVELNEAVDTRVVVTVVWIGPPADTRLSTGGRITVSDVTGSRPTYQSTVVITSLEMSDSGAYTCTVTASGNGTTFVTESQPAGSATTIVQSVEPFDVTITDTGMSTAGQMYTLTCSVEVPGTPSIQWQYSNGSVVTNGGDITVSIPEPSGTTTTLTITFDPLLTSHGGEYTCQATAETTGVNRTATWNVTVQISASTVTITRTPERPLYPGDDVNLTCTFDVGGAVDTPVMMAVDITGPGGLILSGSQSLMATETTYQRTVTLTSLSDSTSGDYTCNTIVCPYPPSEFVTGWQGSNVTTISLEQYDISINATGVPTAGEEYNLSCSVNVSARSPSIQWECPNGSVVTTGGDITVGIEETTGTITTLTLTFDPLITSHGGGYLCRSVVEGTVERTAMENVTVQIPNPSVTLSRDPESGTLRYGDNLTLTCTIQLDGAIDTRVDVIVVWNGPPGNISPNNPTPTMDSDTVYESTVTFTSLVTSNSGDYICTATVSPDPSSEFITESGGGTDTLNIIVDLPRTEVEITTPDGTPSAAKSYILTCTVEVVEGLVVAPYVEWLDPENNVVATGGDITVASPEPSGTITTLTLTFDPLLTSHGGEYTCRANITIEEISIIDLSNTSSTDVIVQIPPPHVSITRDSLGTLYAGTTLTFTCTIELDEQVDTEVMVTADWTRLDGSMMNNTCISITEASLTGPLMYESRVMFDPLSNDPEDGGTYTCMAIVSPVENEEYIRTGSNNNTISINITDLPSPEVEITAPDGTPSAAKSYILTCTVEVVEGLVVTPTVEWLDPENNVVASGGDITVGIPEPSGTITTLTLTFNPLLTSHGGEYTCRANITIEEIFIIDLSNTSSTDVIVQIPPPIVTTTADQTPYNGSAFTITCNIVNELNSSIDTDVTVTGTWSRMGQQLSTDTTTTCITVSDTDSSYQTTLTFDPLGVVSSHDGSYICEATVAPNPPTAFILETTSQSDGHDLVVQALPSPETLFTPTGMLVLGGSYTITCSVDVTEGLRDPADVTRVIWIEPGGGIVGGGGGDVSVEDPEATGKRTDRILTFTSFHEDQGGVYTCTGCVFVNSCNGDPFITNHCDDTSVCITSGTPEKLEGDPVCTSVSDQTLQLSWSKPLVSECNGFAIVSYELEVQKYTSTEDGVLDTERLDGPETFSPTSQPLAFTSQMTQVDGLEIFVPYEVCISAATVAGTGGSRSCQDCFTREGTPSIAPRNMTAERTSRTTIIVSWIPLNLVEAQGFVTYTVFYDLITSGKRQQSGGMKTVPGNESSTIIGGLQNRDYEVSVVTSTVAGEGPRSVAITSAAPTTSIFQIQLTGIPNCPLWVSDSTEAKLEDIQDGVQLEIETLCRCGFTIQHLSDSEFQCFTDLTEVTFRARLYGTAQVTSSELIRYIEQWIAGGGGVPVLSVRYTTDSTCHQVEISSFNDPECGTTTEHSTSDNTAAFIGGVVAVVLIVAMATTIIIIAIVTLVLKNRRASVTLQKAGRSRWSELPLAGRIITSECTAYGAPTTHSLLRRQDSAGYEIPDIGVPEEGAYEIIPGES